ncbi:MAG: glycerol-3-phosphate acyltransferase [Syntrophomonadaceae bacterium]|nr:glycerol-3-phosphate acyltransferase [Syntrophomonadaceae bacterium]
MMIAAALLVSYLLGSIPSAYIVGQLSRGIDIRQHGSGNVGTMNTRAVLGWPAAIFVFIIDVVKGAAAVYLSTMMAAVPALLLACLVVLGHIYPIWLGFQGGKGLATALGAVLAAGQFGPILVFASGWSLFVLCFYLWQASGEIGNHGAQRTVSQINPVLSYVQRCRSDLANITGSVLLLIYALLTGPNYWLTLLAVIITLRHIQTLRQYELPISKKDG